MTTTDPIDFRRQAGRYMQALGGIEQMLDASGLDGKLRHLVKLRASQINGCAFCVIMHTSEARRDGETSERLDRVVVWRGVDDFSPRERAALAWTEALTRLAAPDEIDNVRAELGRHFGGGEIATLTVAIGMINLWNRLQIGSHGSSRIERAAA